MNKNTMNSYNALIKAKVWTKQDCQRIAKALNALRFTSTQDEARTFMIDWKARFDAKDTEYSITKDHSEQGINYLLNYAFKKNGETRKSCKLGWLERDILKNFKSFKFVGYYNNYEMCNSGFYCIIYRCYAKDGRYFDYCPMHWSDPLVVNVNPMPTKARA